MVNLAILALELGLANPAVWFVEDVSVFLPLQLRLRRLVLLQAVELFQEQEPGGLFRVIQLGGAVSLFPENVVDVLEGLFEHGRGAFK